ncbi:MAG TPA: hypothetical protein IAA29_17320 [Candidatus Paenibacillus intestinavium]|nr:hypothetical protein [Candidatus Paenibacillus intestinavium]
MKKVFTIVLTIAMVMTISSCSNDTGTQKLLDKEGVAPFELSENDTFLLQSLALVGDVNIISFKAPKIAKTLKANVYILEDNGIWNTVGGGQISLGEYAAPDGRLEGTFAMLLKDDYAIDMHINTNGRASYQIGKLDVDYKIVASTKGFLTDFQEIELDKEIPVAIMIYDSGTSMKSYSTESFFSPSEFEGMDLVQVVTLTFTE